MMVLYVRLAKRLGVHPSHVSKVAAGTYRPLRSPFFACRQCHDLTYLCVQKHDARLDPLVNAPAVQQVPNPGRKKRMSGEQACTGQNSRSVTPLRSIQFMCVPYRQLLR